MNLLIVESPAKSKTIEKFLGSNYKVLASYGHVRDLPQKELGIDVNNNYEPSYQVMAKAKKNIDALKQAYKNAETVYLATDLDREGEAISWHLAYVLDAKNKDKKMKRITFSEITKVALEDALAHSREIDQHLVDAQQARRVLDRLVGYKLSPFLWKKVKSGLSAGRVQSVAVRLIVEREREIEKFNPVEYWLLAVDLEKSKKNFRAVLKSIDGKAVGKMGVHDEETARGIESNLGSATYAVKKVEARLSTKKSVAPFTTSTLQIEIARKLGYSPKQTMLLAQKLYEAGHITYMRTDSVNLSTAAVESIKSVILEKYGKQYLAVGKRDFQSKTKRAQEAHEAIRPTHFEKMKVSDDSREQKLYELVWKRAVASQMSDAVYNVIDVDIETDTAKKYVFAASGRSVSFDGFMKLYEESASDDEKIDDQMLPEMKVSDILNLIKVIADQKFTEPPKRYTEAMLVKKLESLGIGRPSTYAPTLETIKTRGYVELENKKFSPTDIGKIVTDLLVKHFVEIVDYDFTAKMEDEFDDIADGKLKWQKVIDAFYKPFAEHLVEKQGEIKKTDIMPIEKTGEQCPDCGSDLLIKHGRFGKFIACSGYPKCKYSKPLETKAELKNDVVLENGKTESLEAAEEIKCEKCGAKMVLKEGRFGKFLACENYPTCKNTKTVTTNTGVKCPECEKGDLLERKTKFGKTFWGCSRYPECKYASWQKPEVGGQEAEVSSQEPGDSRQ
ncbi:MAG: type I DNA topoisomerase [Candidatus Berkelbacteria bacterium]